MTARQLVGILWWCALGAGLAICARTGERLLADLAQRPADSAAFTLLTAIPLWLTAAGLIQLAWFCRDWRVFADREESGPRALDRTGFLIIAAALIYPFTRVIALSFSGEGEPVLHALASSILGPVWMAGLMFGLLMRLAAVLMRRTIELELENQAFV